MNLIRIISLLGISSLLTVTECAKILVLLPLSSKSHKNVFRPIVHELASRGHRVTMVFPYKDEKSVENVKEIVIDANKKLMMLSGGEIVKKMIATKQTLLPSKVSQLTLSGAENYFNNSEVLSLLATRLQFDLAIVHNYINEGALASAYLVAKHVAVLSPMAIITPSPSSPPNPLATIPNLFFGFPTEKFFQRFYNAMNFFQRFYNAIMSTITWKMYKYMTYDAIDKKTHSYNPNIPDIEEAKRKICLTLINADPVMTSSRPEMPNVVFIGSAHCKPAKTLSKDFSDFIDSSGDDGFILFSLGSLMEGKFLPKETQKEILKAFSRLKQKVIWKFEEKLDDLPSNVMVTPWAPQQDILGHPKIRLFITHGGLLSLQESIYHGVPVIGIPLFSDQPANVDRLVEVGLGDRLDIDNITAHNLYAKIQKIIHVPSYKLNAQELSAIARDQSVTSMEKAMYWIEYVINHNGADHLHGSQEQLDYFQYYCLDILLFLGITFSAFTFITRKLISYFIIYIKNRK